MTAPTATTTAQEDDESDGERRFGARVDKRAGRPTRTRGRGKKQRMGDIVTEG